MAPKKKLGAGVSAGRGDVRNLKDELLNLDERLRELVDALEEEPSSIDGGVLGNNDCSGEVETAIMGVYRLVKGRVFSAESPLRADNELWEAFREQQGEFMEFYRSALRAVEIHKEILQYYGLVKDVARLRPRHGDLERIRQDKCAYVTERDECIAAVSNFCGKFSAMLTAL